jgi:hypothetical protein
MKKATTKAEPKKKFLVIRERDTKNEVRRIEFHDKSENQVVKIMLGILRNMDDDKFYIDDTEA